MRLFTDLFGYSTIISYFCRRICGVIYNILSHKVDMKTCLWYYPQDNVVVIKAFHPSVAANWKVLEKVFSPFRDYITNVNPAF